MRHATLAGWVNRIPLLLKQRRAGALPALVIMEAFGSRANLNGSLPGPRNATGLWARVSAARLALCAAA